eukprot:2414488-Pleurochrysis_carterae.AAC.1
MAVALRPVSFWRWCEKHRYHFKQFIERKALGTPSHRDAFCASAHLTERLPCGCVVRVRVLEAFATLGQQLVDVLEVAQREEALNDVDVWVRMK